MIAEYWDLTTTAFRDPVQAGFFHSGSGDEALARLQFLIEQRHRLGILLGGSGVGKTTLLQRAAFETRMSGSQVCLVNLIGATNDELMTQLGTQMSFSVSNSAAANWQQLVDQIDVNGLQQTATVLLFDDADQAEDESLRAISRIASLCTKPHHQLTIVLASHEDHYDLLGRRLLEMSSLRVDLQPWTNEETQRFVREELHRCGRDRAAFDTKALEYLYAATGGIPRKVCLLSELALAAGAGQQLRLIDVETVQAVAEELQVEVQG